MRDDDVGGNRIVSLCSKLKWHVWWLGVSTTVQGQTGQTRGIPKNQIKCCPPKSGGSIGDKRSYPDQNHVAFGI
jgi:hypothetical protein